MVWRWLAYCLAILIPIFELSGTVPATVVLSFIFLGLGLLLNWRGSLLVMGITLDVIEPASWPVWLSAIGIAVLLMTLWPVPALVKKYGWYAWIIPGLITTMVIIIARVFSLSTISVFQWGLLGQQIITTWLFTYGIFGALMLINKNKRTAFSVE